MAVRFCLHPGIDFGELRDRWQCEGRVAIKPFLPDAQARELRHHLLARDDWLLWLCDHKHRHYKLSSDEIAAWGQERIAGLRSLVEPMDGTSKFGFAHHRIDIFDEHKDSFPHGLLGEFAVFLNSRETLDLVRSISGIADIDFADSFAARYDPGDFLSEHDDLRPTRKVAYVAGLTQDWDRNWGGELVFLDADGQAAETLVPDFNTLILFNVPIQHAVVKVAATAAEPRLTVTGWFRDLKEKT